MRVGGEYGDEQPRKWLAAGITSLHTVQHFQAVGMACGVAPAVSTINPQTLTAMTKSNILAVAFALGIILCSLGIIGLLCGISREANIISALLAATGMLLAFGSEALNPKRPAR